MTTTVASLFFFAADHKPLPWRAMADDMKAAGLSYNRQASCLGLGFSTYQRYLDGTEPKYSIGTVIKALHLQVCGQSLHTLRCNSINADAVDIPIPTT